MEIDEKFARAKSQLASIERALAFSAATEEEKIALEPELADRLNLLVQAGASPLAYPDGGAIGEFDSFADVSAWAEEHPELAAQPGSFNTVLAIDPATHKYTILILPSEQAEQAEQSEKSAKSEEVAQ